MGKFTARSRAAARAFGAASAAFALALALAPAAAAAPDLRWKFKEGDTLHYRMDQKTVTQVKANGQDIKTTVTQTIDTTWSVGAVDKGTGSASMSQTIDRLRTRIESPFGAFEYDSEGGKVPEGPIAAGVVPMLKALVGSKFRYTMSPQGELSDVSVPESLVKALKEAGPAGGNVGMFSEEGLKNMINESSLVIPGDAAASPTWTRQTRIPSPPIGTMVLDKTYKLEGTDAGREKIGLAVKISLETDPKSNFDIKVVSQDGKGQFHFDTRAGRVADSNVSQKVDLLIKVMNSEVNQSSDMSTTMTLVDPKGGGPK